MVIYFDNKEKQIKGEVFTIVRSSSIGCNIKHSKKCDLLCTKLISRIYIIITYYSTGNLILIKHELQRFKEHSDINIQKKIKDILRSDNFNLLHEKIFVLVK